LKSLPFGESVCLPFPLIFGATAPLFWETSRTRYIAWKKIVVVQWIFCDYHVRVDFLYFLLCACVRLLFFASSFLRLCAPVFGVCFSRPSNLGLFVGIPSSIHPKKIYIQYKVHCLMKAHIPRRMNGKIAIFVSSVFACFKNWGICSPACQESKNQRW
jgi:hypothetical protein